MLINVSGVDKSVLSKCVNKGAIFIECSYRNYIHMYIIVDSMCFINRSFMIEIWQSLCFNRLITFRIRVVAIIYVFQLYFIIYDEDCNWSLIEGSTTIQKCVFDCFNILLCDILCYQNVPEFKMLHFCANCKIFRDRLFQCSSCMSISQVFDVPD